MPPLPTHLRVLATWAAILPLALATRALIAPLVTGWPEPLALALTISIVVPIAVLWAVPLVLRGIAAIRTRRLRTRHSTGAQA